MLGIYMDGKLLATLTKEARRRGVPTSTLVENLLRKELGLTPVDPSPFTPKRFLK